MLERIEKYFKEQKPYLESDLSPQCIINELDIPRRHLSQALNLGRNKNFNSYVNGFRVNEMIDKIREKPEEGL